MMSMNSSGVTAVEEGYSALTAGCALFDAPKKDRLVVSGDDRRRFVNGLVSCDVRELESGRGAYGFFTSAQGRVLADVTISASDNELALDLPEGRGELISAHMLEYKVADRVEVVAAEARDELLIAGPRSVEVVAVVLGDAPAEPAWEHGRVRDLDVLAQRRLGVVAFRLRGAAEVLYSTGKSLEKAGALRSSAGALDAVRVERGLPWFGIDFDEGCFPQETGLESEAVSYTKGCYLGQEIIARIHYRGHVNRHLRGLLAAEGVDLRVDQDVTRAGEIVGSVSTAAFSPRRGSHVGLALLHRKAEPGEIVYLPNDGQATVVELPFAVPGREAEG